jgi:hypothetical protein
MLQLAVGRAQTFFTWKRFLATNQSVEILNPRADKLAEGQAGPSRREKLIVKR